MIYAAPSTLFEATVQGAGTGLVGTMGVRIKAVPSGTTVLARTTAGITEVNPGIYTKQLTAPATLGDYLVIWDDGTNYASEELKISYTLPDVSPSGGALLSLAEYQAATGNTDNPTAQQIALEDASAACLTYTDRDFVSTPVTETRDFTYRGNGFLEIDDATAVHSVSSDFPITSWFANSDGPAGFGVLSWLELPKYDSRALTSIGAMGFTSNLDVILARSGWTPRWTVSVNADWGIAPLPRDVRRGLIIQAQAYENASVDETSGPLTSETVAETSRSYAVFTQPQPVQEEDAGIEPAAQALWWPYKRHTL